MTATAAVHQVETLSDGWYRLQRYTVDVPGVGVRDLEVCRRGDSAAVLLLHRRRGTVVLTRQFRLPVLVNGRPDGQHLEVPGGLIGEDDPLAAARREVEEETGIRPPALRQVLVAHLAPSLVTERVHLFVAEFDDADRRGAGGGVAEERECIEVVEYPAAEVYALAERGEITDARTLLLLYFARANGLLPHGPLPGGARPGGAPPRGVGATAARPATPAGTPPPPPPTGSATAA